MSTYSLLQILPGVPENVLVANKFTVQTRKHSESSYLHQGLTDVQ